MRTKLLIGFLLLAVSLSVTESRPATENVDRVAVWKTQRTLILMSRGRTIKSFKVALGSQPVGKKVQQGDHKTPEGTYTLDRRNSHSQFYKSIHISYPNAEDLAHARKLGVSPGGDIFIHGLPNGYGWVGKDHRLRDWTDGCIAVTNDEIDEIWRIVPDGTVIDIHP